MGEHFINPCCFGEDLAAWLRIKLVDKNIEVFEPYQEDWGWELPAKHGSDSYYLCMSGNSDGSSTNEDEGEWRIIVEKRRSIWQRLRGDGKIAADDRMARIIEEFLSGEPAVRGVTARSKVKCANLDFWEASDTGSYDRVSAWNW